MSNRYFNKAIRKDIYSNRYNGNTYSFVVATHLDTLSQDPTSTGIVFTGPTSIPEYQQFVPLTYNNCIVFGINGNLTPRMVELVQINQNNISQVVTPQTFNLEKSVSDFYFRSITNEVYPLIPVGSSVLGPTGSNYGIYTSTVDYITSHNSVNYFIYTKN